MAMLVDEDSVVIRVFIDAFEKELRTKLKTELLAKLTPEIDAIVDQVARELRPHVMTHFNYESLTRDLVVTTKKVA